MNKKECPAYCLAALVALATFVATGARAAAAGPAVATQIPSDAIVLDGRLDEAAWNRAEVIELTQQEPRPGAPTPYVTEVRILADGQHLYFGFTNHDPQPQDITVHTLQRDDGQDADDHVTIVLDTFGARRLGYWFQINAGGARSDGLNVNTNTDDNWNGIWNAAVSRTPSGWTAEIAISTQSLQFDANLEAWGLNVGRYVPRDQLSLRWAGITLDSGIFDLRRAGELRGIGGLKQGVGLAVMPYALARYNSAPGSDSTGDVGIGIKYNFKPQLEGILAVNPDFAEAEAEEGRVNLSRFSLFFPEKRPFFLEGSNLFEFGYGLNIGDDGNLSTQFVPYFSRRIGLVGGQIVPIDAGAKLIGHVGDFSVGLLDVETAGGAVAPSTNLAVARAAYDVSDEFRIGTLLTHGDPAGLADNSYAGVDGVWRTSQFRGDKNLTISGWYGRSYGDLAPGRADGYGAAIEYPNDLWYAFLKVNEFGDALDPALGFLPRPGTRQYLGIALFRPRPQGGRFDWVRQFQFGGEYIQVDDLEGIPESKELAVLPFRMTTESGYFFDPVFVADYEALEEPFTVAPGVTIPAGEYRFNRYSLRGNTPESRPLVFYANVSDGDFFTGTLRSTSAEIEWTSPDGRLQLGLENENNFGYLPQGDFIIRLTQLEAAWSFTPDLALSTFVQHDSLTDELGVNARLQWIIQPGRELFVVFNHGIEPQLGDLNRAPPTGNAVIVKLRWDTYW
ncbi:MAG TPA: DUF5916 domain-containing protein [Woeseiaceae bacterium]|nr:DUF5916 domain-containing protein [Woeseiaceae bacterium]